MRRIALTALICFMQIMPAKATIATEDTGKLMFRSLTTADGLSSNSVTALLHDSRGYLWVGTTYGLNRFDAYTVQRYYAADFGSNRDEIIDLSEDTEGNIWIHTKSGMTVYDYETGIFSTDVSPYLRDRYAITTDVLRVGTGDNMRFFWAISPDYLWIYDSYDGSTSKFRLSGDVISDVFIKDASTYILFTDGRLSVIDPRDKTRRRISVPEDYRRTMDNSWPHLFIDKTGNIWIYSDLSPAIYRLSHFTGEWNSVPIPDDSGGFNRITSIRQAPDGKIWITSTHTAGFIYDPGTGEMSSFRHDQRYPNSVASNNLNSLIIDDDGTVWIGNYKSGVSYWSAEPQVFINHQFGDQYDIQALCEEGDYLWMGTDGNGLLRLDKRTGKIVKVNIGPTIIRTIVSDGKGTLWIGTYRNGMYSYNDGHVRRYDTAGSDIASDDIYTIVLDADGNVILGTLNGIIQKLYTDSGKFATVYRSSGDNIRDMLISDNGKYIYSATSAGLIRTDLETWGSEAIIAIPKSHMYSVLEDSEGNIWTGGVSGIYYYNPKTGDATHIAAIGNGKSVKTNSLVEDRYHRIWAGTVDGLSFINPSTYPMVTINYTEADGLPTGTINEESMLLTSDGNILVGTSSGITEIIPKPDKYKEYSPTVHLSAIYPTFTDSDILQGKSTECADEIVLKEGFRALMLAFSNLVFTDNNSTYSYRIKGQSEWVDVPGNIVQIGMLRAGKYQLEVRVRNANHVYSPNIKIITIRILPPWYRTWWAWLLWIFIPLTVAALIINAEIRRKRKEEAVRMEAEEMQRARQLADMKVQFFANVSHELRTPLSLIINPLEEFMARKPEYGKSILATVRNNALYLLELINQLLDFRKLDAGGETMNYVHGDVLALVKDQMASFESTAAKRGIDFRLVAKESSIMMDFDYDKVRKIVMNIISNAFKFTPDKGTVSVAVENRDGKVVLSFRDSGCGIKDEDKEKVFKYMYQSDNQENSVQGGTGIGLYLVAEYVRMHNGTVEITDNKPSGTVITVSIPARASGISVPVAVMAAKSDEQVQGKEESRNGNYTIMLVDDNADFLNFLAYSLSATYNIVQAANGKEALKLMESENPDLIISDVMMPGMDGLELCSAVKTDIRFSHIPVILLTAKAGEQFQLEGLEHGADDYISKPFSMDILKIRIEKIISDTMKRRGYFNNDVKIEPSKITITSLDKQFIQKAISIIEDHMNDGDISVEMLAEKLNISRGYLYKKLVMITGKVPISFIREIRMKRALQWVMESQLQVSEIAYKMGYNSPKVFTRHFKDVFGMTPTEYQKKHSNS